MKRIVIKDKDLLIRILKTVSWLDTCRWSVENSCNVINFSRGDLTNCEKILTHWVCYVTDRKMPFGIVWDRGGYVFSDLVYEYSRKGGDPEKILESYYESYRREGEERFRFRSGDVTFASRYVTEDYQNILQTLEVLDRYEVDVGGRKYKRNIVAFVLDFLQRFEGEDDLLVRVACALHLLTYHLNKKEKNSEEWVSEILDILRDERKFEERLVKFKRTSTTGKKRLWCCVRDYKKGVYNRVFNDAIKEVVDGNYRRKFLSVWNGLPMDQIELPGDVWNNSPLLRDNLFADVLNFNTIPKSWNMPRIIREIYNQLKGEVKGFYPEQLDVTFDFVPRMCNRKLCDVCLFGENGVDPICIPTKDKYCPVALISCGYKAKCEEENCIIKEGISKGICKGRLKQL